MHCSVIEHSIMSLSFQTAVQKNEAKLSSFVQFETKWRHYVHSHIQSDVIACTVL